MQQGERPPLAIQRRAPGLDEPVVQIEADRLGVLFVDIDTQAAARLADEIEQRAAKALPPAVRVDEEHLHMGVVEADEALRTVIGIDRHPYLDSGQIKVADLRQEPVDVGGLKEVVGRAHGAQPDIEQPRVVRSNALANEHEIILIQRITKGIARHAR